MSEGEGVAQGSLNFKYDMNPPDLNSCRNYEHYRNQLRLWKMNTKDDIPKERQGCLIVSSLPDESKRFGNLIQETVINKVGWDNLEKPDGLAKVEAELEKLLGKHIVVSTVDAWKALIRCKKQQGQTVAEYVRRFEATYGKLKASGTTLPSEILGVMLMEGAGLSSNQEENVRQHINLDKKEEVFDVVKGKMLNMLGDSIGGSQEMKIKEEPGCDEAMATTRFRKPWQKNGSKKINNFEVTGKVNSKGSDGKILRCNNCDSVKHLFRDCPHANEKKWKDRDDKPRGRWVYQTEEGKTYSVEEERRSNESSEDSEAEEGEYEVNKYAFFTTNKKGQSRLTKEYLNSAALDTGCTSNVAGLKWMEFYLKELPFELKKQVKGPHPSKRSFSFGNNCIKVAKERYVIPAKIADKIIMIGVDVVDSDIPLLICRKEMKKWNMVLNVGEDKAFVDGKEVDISVTSDDHYTIYLLNDIRANNTEVSAVGKKATSKAEKVETVKKLHKQLEERHKQSSENLLISGDGLIPSNKAKCRDEATSHLKFPQENRKLVNFSVPISTQDEGVNYKDGRKYKGKLEVKAKANKKETMTTEGSENRSHYRSVTPCIKILTGEEGWKLKEREISGRESKVRSEESILKKKTEAFQDEKKKLEVEKKKLKRQKCEMKRKLREKDEVEEIAAMYDKIEEMQEKAEMKEKIHKAKVDGLRCALSHKESLILFYQRKYGKTKKINKQEEWRRKGEGEHK